MRDRALQSSLLQSLQHVSGREPSLRRDVTCSVKRQVLLQLAQSLAVARSVAELEICCSWQALAEFVTKARLGAYEKSRNDPNADAVSSLSPYIHFGQLAPGRCALEAGKMKTSAKVSSMLRALILDGCLFMFVLTVTYCVISMPALSHVLMRCNLRCRSMSAVLWQAAVDGFLEEIIVRRELADNFCYVRRCAQ